jgi:ABC-type branched-subunit amino acid transport system ATPase component
VSRAEPILRIESLRRHFGGVRALDGVSLDVAPGEFRAIIGPNGAGKSTFFNTVTGLVRADGGRVVFDGKDVTGRPPHAMAREGISRTFQITSVFRDLTVLENLQVALLVHRGMAWTAWRPARAVAVDRAREVLDLVGLGALGGSLGGALSHGDQKRLDLALALAGDPRLLLLDEPTAGMAAAERLASIALVHRIARELGLTVVFTEHDMAVVWSVATRITVLHQGRVLTEGSPEAVRANPQVQQVYLGETEAGAA